MKCAKAEQLMALAVEGDATATETRNLDRHLETCAVCLSFRRELEASQAALKSLAGEEVAAAVYAQIRVRVQEKVSESRRPWWTLLFLPPRRQYALATGLTGAIVAFFLFDLGREPGAPPPASMVEQPAPESVPQSPGPRPLPLPAVEPPVEPAALEVAEPLPRPTLAATPVPPPEPAAVAVVIPAAAPTTAPAFSAPEPAAGESAVRPRPAPVVVKIVSDNPDIVIYWLVEPKEKTNESFIG